MKNKNSETIHVGTNEEIVSIVNKLEQCEGDEITLVVPSEALLLQSVVNLKILKKKAGEFRKAVSIITDDKNGENKNEREVEIGNEKTKDFKNNRGELIGSASTEINAARKKKVKMFDIVKKANKTDGNKKEGEKKTVIENTESEDNIDNKLNAINYKTEIKSAAENELNEKRFSGQNNIRISESKFAGAVEPRASVDFQKTKKRKIILPSISSKIFAVFIFICVATTALIAFFVFQKVNIVIALKTQETDYNFEFIADESVNGIDTIDNKIPAEKIEIVNEETKTYPAMGKRRVTKKASGEITVYNEYSSNPQKIVANTRFLSKDGHLFRINESIIIPGFSRIEGKDVPGEVVVKIYADAPGEEYNIGPSSFHLPGLQGHPKYSSIYARSSQAMSGGIDKDVLYFSESDYITAKNKLIKIIKEKSEQDFLSKVSDNVILLKNTKQESDVKVETSVKIGDIADDFEMTVSMKTSALFVNKDNLESLISEKINSELEENMELVKGNRKYEIGETVKNENGNIVMPIHITQGIVAKINADKIKEEITGKSELELNNYFNNIREIKSVNVEFWPKWVKNVPLSSSKINIEFER